MIISSTSDYRRTAEQRLPPFLFHDMDDGAYAANTLRRNVRDLADVALRQLVRENMNQLNTSTELFGEKKMRIAIALTSANKVANITEKCLNKKQ